MFDPRLGPNLSKTFRAAGNKNTISLPHTFCCFHIRFDKSKFPLIFVGKYYIFFQEILC